MTDNASGGCRLWAAWLHKPSLWRWPSTKRSLLYAASLIVLMLVFEAVFLAGGTQPFLMRSAMRLHSYSSETNQLSSSESERQYLRINSLERVSTNRTTDSLTDVERNDREQKNTDTEPNTDNDATNISASLKMNHDTENTIRNSSNTEANSSSRTDAQPSSSECSPTTLDTQSIAYRNENDFYSMLQNGSARFPPPVFQGDAMKLCDEKTTGKTRKWDYCLPISGSKDEAYCHAKDRNDLLRAHTPDSLCFNSALHMLIVEVYEEMNLVDVRPAVLYGTLLGAVRDGLTIPFTEDADIGFNTQGESWRMDKLKRKLAKKGYHMFYHKIWRVCIAPTHPLASNLYNPAMELLRGAWDAPYVDLYEMKLKNETTYRVDEAWPNPMIARDKIEPFSQVSLHGMKYDTVADPHYFLKREYGRGYMTPRSRRQRAPRTRKPSTDSVSASSSNSTSTNADNRNYEKASTDKKTSGLRNSEMQIVNSSYECSPKTIDVKAMELRHGDGFYSQIQSAQFPAPVFQGDATSLCDEKATGKTRRWDYCLPISGNKDETYCHAKDRNDLLRPHTPDSLCFNSALHMLMADVYEEMKLVDLHPAILYGTLLGAVRDGLTIPFTEDADIGFNSLGDYERLYTMKEMLAKKGYHMFYYKIWRVCIAPTHPLASNLYNPAMELLRGAWDAPYVDLYEMRLQNSTTYSVDEAWPSPMIPRGKIVPFSQVTLHGRKYDTVADPHYFLKREYGRGYMTPRSRKQRAPRTHKPSTSDSTKAVTLEPGTS